MKTQDFKNIKKRLHAYARRKDTSDILKRMMHFIITDLNIVIQHLDYLTLTHQERLDEFTEQLRIASKAHKDE